MRDKSSKVPAASYGLYIVTERHKQFLKPIKRNMFLKHMKHSKEKKKQHTHTEDVPK